MYLEHSMLGEIYAAWWEDGLKYIFYHSLSFAE